MMSFDWTSLSLLWQLGFMASALAGGVLASLSCALMGPFVVVRKMGAAAGGIAHSMLGGMGIALYAGIHPVWGAVASSLLAALVITYVNQYYREKEDTLIAALWAFGMAVGIIFISKTPGYTPDLNSYLFGNILMADAKQMWVTLVLFVVISLSVFTFYRPLVAVCFDWEFAKLRGVPVFWIELMLMVLVALSVVVLMQLVGLLMVIALLTMPAAAAMMVSRSVGQMMFWSAIYGLFATVIGIHLAFFLDLPAGPTIILLVSFLFVGILTLRALGQVHRSR